MAPYVQDALNELEFITGDTSTTYGAIRASLGYPDPWTINYVEVGNEDNLSDGLDSYIAYRFELFFNAIRAAYPNMTIIASTVDEELSNSAQDYHQYTRPDRFVTQFDWFDNYPLDHLTLAGEYACVQPNDGILLDETNWDEPKFTWPFVRKPNLLCSQSRAQASFLCPHSSSLLIHPKKSNSYFVTLGNC